MNMNIKTKLTYGIGLLFVLITLLGGLAIKNIHNVSDDTQNILADNYNSLLYSRQMLESLDAIRAYSSYVSLSAPFRLGGLDWDATVAAVPWETSFYNPKP